MKTDMQEILEKAKDTVNVRQAFGEPYERDGVTIIPVAKVGSGGAGGGGEGTGGPDGKGPGTGSGQGFGYGLGTTPIGVYVIKNGTVEWQPAVDVTQIVLRAQLVAIVGLLTIRSIAKHRRKRR